MHEMLYAPTYFALRDQQRSPDRHYVVQDADTKNQRVKAKKKGKLQNEILDLKATLMKNGPRPRNRTLFQNV